MGLMGSLYTGVSGLQVSQRGLNTTAHNLSNMETEGYVRQQTLQTDSFYSNIGMTHISYMQVGHGAAAAAITQVRDLFLDKAYRQELGRQKFYEAQYECATEMEEILGETEGVAFQDSVEGLWVAMQELCKEPDNIVTRSSFIQTAVSFIERAETVYTQIKDYQLSLNSNIRNTVNRINEIADEIHRLNGEIQKYEASKMEHANDYRDARNLLLDELGGIADISYKEHANGVVTVQLENQQLVSEDLVYHMDTRLLENDTGMIEPYWPSFGDVPVFNFDPLPSSEANTDIGTLKGLLLVRGDKVGKHTDIPVEPDKADYTDETGYFYQDDYDEAYKKYEEEVRTFNMEIEASAIVCVQAEFDRLIHGIVTTINDLLCPNKEVLTADGEKIYIFDEENAPVGMDANFTPGEALFNRKSMERYEKTTAMIEVDGIFQEVEVWKYNEEDPSNNYSLFTLGEIEVNANIMKDPSLIPLSSNDRTGDYAVEICEKMLTEWQEPFSTLTPNEYKEHNFNEYYTEMIGALATRGEKFKNIYQGQETLVNSVDTQRLSVTAVSSDEELTNMIRFQQAYNASARYINVVSQMLEHLLNSLG
ncbi:MAG: flagellar hook-associated protein FlgK [Lachnospiraceae bacterium]|nr:flagellar hook-associated protein FlgK [Lachnospiraceae bacterium]